MTFVWAIARAGAVVAAIGLMIVALPPASVYDTGALTVPSVVWTPLVGVLHLNRYFPITELLVLAGFTVAIQAGMAVFWMVSWVLRHVIG